MDIANVTPFLKGCERGHILTVQMYLNNPAFDPSLDSNAGFLLAYANSHAVIVEELTNDRRFNFGSRADRILLASVRLKLRSLFDRMCASQDESVQAAISDALVEAVRVLDKDDLYYIKTLLAHPRCDPKHNCSAALVASVKMKSKEVYCLIASHPSYNPEESMDSIEDPQGLLLAAIESDNTAAALDCLALERCDLNHNDWEAAKLTVRLNRVEVLSSFLESERFDKLSACSHLLFMACRDSSVEIVALLLEEGTYTTEEREDALMKASEHGRYKIVEHLLEDSIYSTRAVSRALVLGCTSNRPKTIQLLLDHPLCAPAYNNNAALYAAVDNHSPYAVGMLLKHPPVERLIDNKIVNLAMERRNTDIFIMLSQYTRPWIDAETVSKYAKYATAANVEMLKAVIEWIGEPLSEIWNEVCLSGSFNMIEYMLTQFHIRPTMGNLRALCNNNQLDSVKLVLPLIARLQDHNRILVDACKKRFTKIVCVLLEDKRFDPSWNKSELLVVAVQTGNTAIVKTLLSDYRVDPACRNNKPIRLAAREDHADIVQLLVADSRVDPSACNNYAVRVAVGESWHHLMKSPRVLAKVSNSSDLTEKYNKKMYIHHTMLEATKSYSYTSSFLEYMGWEDYGYW